MATIFPREEKTEQIFKKILSNEDACKRLAYTFFESLDCGQEEELEPLQFCQALLNAYKNRDLTSFLIEICGNSMFDLLRNSFLTPLKFDWKHGNPLLLTEESGELLDQKKVSVSLQDYHRFKKILAEGTLAPKAKMYLAYGAREEHHYQDATMKVETVKVGKHIGILLLYEFPDTKKEGLTEVQAYAIVWDALQELQEHFPRAAMFYGQEEEVEKTEGYDELGIFLPMHRFFDQMERKVEQANGIALSCREKMEKKILQKQLAGK